MAAIVDSTLANNTVTYNGVQFGGSDSDYDSTPPQIAISVAEPVYDESGRAVMVVRHVLTVRCMFYATSETNMATTMEAIRRKLNEPGKELKILGMGTGFGTITTDIMSGPKPMPASLTPIGPVCFEVVWAIEFSIKPCTSSNQADLAFIAFNYTSSWSNNYEGIVTRRINGYVMIKHHRDPNNPKQVLHVAEQTRGSILIVCPAGFHRTQNDWTESSDKQRLDFSITDEQLEGDVFPVGCTLADGETSFQSGDGRGGFASADISMSMTLKTAPNVARHIAGQIFITAALAKQGAMATAVGGSKGNLYPKFIRIANRKYNDARITQCSISWHMTSSLGPMLQAAGIWEPLTPSTPASYNLWKASVKALWDNRGTAGIISRPEDAVVIDLCDNITSMTIGDSPSNVLAQLAQSLPGFSCPEVPPDGGWISHDLEVKILVDSQQTWHKKAASYLPSIGQIFSGIGIPNYTQEQSDQDTTEYHGYPDVYIGLRFKGLRYKHRPEVPQIKSIGGKPVTSFRDGPNVPKWAFDAFCCPVYYVEGWRIYRVSGYIAGVQSVGSPESCETKTVPQDL